jgi:hypothetical protein
MKEIIWGRVEDVWRLGTFAFACFLLIVWVGTRASSSIFQEAIFHPLREWLGWWSLRHQKRSPRFVYRTLAKSLINVKSKLTEPKL